MKKKNKNGKHVTLTKAGIGDICVRYRVPAWREKMWERESRKQDRIDAWKEAHEVHPYYFGGN